MVRFVRFTIGFASILAGGLAVLGWWMLRMPGRSYRGLLPALTESEVMIRDWLRQDVEYLAGTLGERNVFRPESLRAAADYITDVFKAVGLRPRRLPVSALGDVYENIEAEIPGTEQVDEIVVVGAHYDTVPGCPGANDNASGVATLLALARRLASVRLARTLRLVAFVNEEEPFFGSDAMGSMVYAQRIHERGESIIGMMSLETMGYYVDTPNSQQYPWPLNFFYPSEGNFIAFIGNTASRRFLRQVVGTFRRVTSFPSEGAALPGWIPGVSWSDHWAFWQYGYPGVMVTDTAFYRYPHYHTAEDTPDKLHYDRLARVVAGLEQTLQQLLQTTRW